MSSPSLGHAEYRATRTFANLDGLRALSVLAVLLYHFDPLRVPVLGTIQHAGFFGVDVFFVLSGFLITTLLLREPERPLRKILSGFYVRRTLRIFPLYYAAVGLYALVAWQRGAAAWGGYVEFLPSLALYWSDLRLAFHPLPFPEFGHSWSLAVEEKFYLLWPLLVLMGRRRCGAVVAAGTVAGVTLWRALVARDPAMADILEARLWYAFDLRIDTMMWGCLLAYALHDQRWYARLAGLVSQGRVQLVFLTTLGLLMAMAVLVDRGAMTLQVRYACTPPLVALALAAVVTQPEASRWRWLQWSPLAFVGRISYGIYVLHPISMSIVRILLRCTAGEEWRGSAATITALVLYLGLTLCVCAASFRWFESPLLRLRQRFR